MRIRLSTATPQAQIAGRSEGSLELEAWRDGGKPPEHLGDRTFGGPRERPVLQGVCASRRRRRSRQHCQQPRDLLRVAGGVGSDATAEAVDGRAKAMQLDIVDSKILGTGPTEGPFFKGFAFLPAGHAVMGATKLSAGHRHHPRVCAQFRIFQQRRKATSADCA